MEFEELIEKLGFTSTTEVERDYIDATVFGDPLRTFLGRETVTLTIRGTRYGDIEVVAGSIKDAQEQALTKLVTGVWM